MEQQAFKQLKINIQNEEYTRVKRRKMYFKRRYTQLQRKKKYILPTHRELIQLHLINFPIDSTAAVKIEVQLESL